MSQRNLTYDCPLCGAKNSPLKYAERIEIQEAPSGGEVGPVRFAFLYTCDSCGYMVFTR